MLHAQSSTGAISRRSVNGREMLWVILGAGIAFGGSVNSGFHFDDYGMLQDPAIVSPGGWTRCWSLWQTRPLTWFSFWLNYRISGRDPMLWHAANLLLHAGCALLLYRVLVRLVPDAALPAALIFALHPIQSEPVDYVYARAILLATLFSLLAIDQWIRERRWIAVLWFTLAVLSKEECVTVPLVLALYEWWKRRGRHAIAPVATMLSIAALAGIRVLAAIQATGTRNIGANAGVSPLAYFSEQGIAILRYFGLLVFPTGFSVDPQLPALVWPWHALAWLTLALLIGVASWRIRTVPLAFWTLAGLILLIPSSSFFPAADLAADRRMYLPMVAFAAAIALLLPFRHPVWVGLLACVLALLSNERTAVWDSDERLWSEAARLAPDKVRPRIQLARSLVPEDALPVLQQAEQRAPRDPDVAEELARVYLQLNRPADALSEAGRAVALQPRDPHAINNRGAVLLAMNQKAAARRDFIAALSVDPCLTEARENLERSGGIPPGTAVCSR